MYMKKIQKNKNNKIWWVVFIAFLIGGVFGFCTHYVVVNWHGFFVRCDDGNRPDKNGCCGGEVYTDAGDGWMVCCPNDGENCFPPLK